MTALQNTGLAALVFAVLYLISKGSGYFSNVPQRTPKRDRPTVNRSSSRNGIKVAKFGTRFRHS